ncbi:MAG: hypothetical protein JSR48_00720 [Verrucomicrobia bacterium]|nr:hypothetical protein [Verrucomicrobiota bacterium]
MRTNVAILSLAGGALLIALSACTSGTGSRSAMPDPRAIHHSGLSQLSLPIAGTFRVSYDPAQFSEAYDVRAARHRNIAVMISTQLQRAGLTRTEQVPDFEVRYTYRTVPAFSGTGYRHAFDLTIIRVKDATGAYKNDLVWGGSAWIDRWPEQDMTYLFGPLIEALLQHFPDIPPHE